VRITPFVLSVNIGVRELMSVVQDGLPSDPLKYRQFDLVAMAE
jgi:hypothetical protein